jgi:dihydroflavonol-4-reductase
VKLLVTGATGFLGSWVTEQLLHSGCKVRVLARRTTSLGALDRPGIDVAAGDIASRESVAAAASDVEAIVHCAGLVSLSPRAGPDLRRANLEGTRNVLEVAASRGARVLHTSTIGTIGPTSDPRVLDESAPPAPLSFDYPYAASKRASESLALDYAVRGADVVVLNPGIVLGPGDPNYSSTRFVLHYLRRELWMHLGGGASFADVRDVSAAYVGALARGRRGERYVLAGMNCAYREVQAELTLLTGLHRSAPMPRPFADWLALWSEAGAAFARHPFEDFNLGVVRWASLYNYCSARKAEQELGYRSRPLQETLADTVVDHLRRGAAQPTTPELRTLLARGVSSSSSIGGSIP